MASNKTTETPKAAAPSTKNGAKSEAAQATSSATAPATNGHPAAPNSKLPPIGKNPHGIPDWRAEQLPYHVESEWGDGEYRYKVVGDTSVEPPPLRDSKYLTPQQSIEIYRYMLINRRMEQALESMYKQSKVIGGLYLSLGQEAASCASAYALDKDDWLGPMIRNQGSMIVKGFRPRDTMMQYMAKGTSPTKGRESGSHYGDIKSSTSSLPSRISATASASARESLSAPGCRAKTSPASPTSATAANPPAPPTRASTSPRSSDSASSSSLSTISGPTPRRSSCSSPAKILRTAPSATASPASSLTGPTPTRSTTPPTKPSSAATKAKAPPSSKPSSCA